ncbi:MAG TPA: DUF255 domain-containing protein [Thermoanaerobaculia bacterium]|nr:DUF255 domain-containing protein [Thermoanaerobaculia bacterium]
MIRRLLPLLILTLSLHAQSRYVADSAGAPVKWEGWGTRALERAKKENRPIFLMVGYASSFACFHMQRTAFLDGEVAQTLNTYFVPVLLDRFEYPEIAASYDTIARATNGVSGTPILMALTPALEPFAISGPLVTGDLSRMLVINANRWAHERDAVTAEAHQNVMKARANVGAPPAAPGAVQDELGGGFHRGTGLFEKMTADQALYAIRSLEAWQTTHDPAMELLARRTLDAALRDLHPQNGAFDASQDAHSLVPAQGPEFWNGAFYVWTKEEVTHLLGHEGAAKVFRAYGMKEGARNVLAVEDATSLKDPAIAPLLAKLLDVRQKRPQPFRESNLISGINGLMISALSRAGAALGERRYVDAAGFAALTVTKKLWNAQKKTLLHSGGVEATCDDYAQLAQGMLDLFEASYDPKWLDLAVALQQRENACTPGATVPQMLGGLLPPRDMQTTAMNLARLSTLTGNEAFRTRLSKDFPETAAQAARDAKIVVVTGDRYRQPTLDALKAIHARLEPFRIVVSVPAKGAARDRMLRALPFTAALAADPENPVTYECSGGECRRR